MVMREAPVAFKAARSVWQLLTWRHGLSAANRIGNYRCRLMSTAAVHEEKNTGSLDTSVNEGLLYFDNTYPLKMGTWDLRYLITRYTRPVELAALVPKDLPIKPKDMQDRMKDGGSFLRFTYEPTTTLPEIEKAVNTHLKEGSHRPWFNPWTSIHSYIVKGKPWVEDLNRFPSSNLRIIFEGSPLPEETMYSIFRKYGRIKDILLFPKENPPYATIWYDRLRSATCAKNCLHGYTIDGVKLHTLYERRQGAHAIRDWIVNHPRISVPAGAALLAALTVTIFDPVRAWFIRTHISETWHIENNKIVRWISGHTFHFIGQKPQAQGTMWSSERSELVEKLIGWLNESAGTFVVVQGPRGSGKRELVVETVLRDRPNVLTVDCEPIINEHGETRMINALASQVGYRPIFSWLNGLSSMMDLASQGLIGQKIGFSETLDTQMRKILDLTSVALKRIALAGKKKTKDGQIVRDEAYLESHPEMRPVIVIDNYMAKGEVSEMLYENIAKWAAELVQDNVAHVVFLGNDISMTKNLAKALPDRVFNSVVLRDADVSVAKQYVLHKLSESAGSGMDDEELTRAIQLLGGRLTDLEVLSQRVAIGESPSEAVNDIIATSTSEILKFYFLGGESGRSWTNEQAWLICKKLAENQTIGYNQVLVDSAFGNNEDPLRALEQSELITIISKNGRPALIQPGRPVYRAAFQKIIGDKVFAAKMELGSISQNSSRTSTKITGFEEELARLSALPTQPWELQGRIRYLLEKLNAAQETIVLLEKRMEENKEVILKDISG